MTGDTVMRKVKLALPMLPDAEIEASKTAMAIAESMRMSPDRIDEVAAAVVEACINALEHSHSSEKVLVTFEVLGEQDPGKLRITVQDAGVGFSPGEIEEPDITRKIKGEAPPRGWGLKIIRELMDEVDISSGPEGTTVVMSKMR